MAGRIKTIVFAALVTALAAAGVGSYFYPGASLARFADIGNAASYLGHFARYAPFISFTVLVFQANIPVIPFFVLVAANGMLFGFWQGIFVTLAGTLLGATLNYWWARLFGAEAWVEKGRRYGFTPEKMQGSRVFWLILLARLTPIVPAPLINIIAGVGKVPFVHFISASLLGKLPYIVFYTLLGLGIYNFRDSRVLYLLAATAVLAACFMLVKSRVKMRSY